MASRLQMVFITEGGGRLRISVADPRPDLTAEEVESAMNEVIAKKIFATRTGDASAILSARIVTTETAELITP